MECSPHKVERLLDTNEAIFLALNAAGGLLTTQLALVEGPLDPDLLQAALAHVQERHPLLRARIQGGRDPRWVTPPSLPLRWCSLPRGWTLWPSPSKASTGLTGSIRSLCGAAFSRRCRATPVATIW